MKEKQKVIGGATFVDKKTGRHYRLIKDLGGGMKKMLCKEDLKAHLMPDKYIDMNFEEV